MALLVILSRWLHVASACVAVGGVFFARVVLPVGLAALPIGQQSIALLPIRRVFKRVIHTAILLLILSGAFNTYVAWDKYRLDPGLLQMLWGVHVLLALTAFSIALYVLARAHPTASARRLLGVNLVVLLAAVAAASSLKWGRDKTVGSHSPSHPAASSVAGP